MSSKRDFIYITDSNKLVYLNQMVNWSKIYSAKVLISSLRFNWYLIVCTAGKFQESLLHVGWTSSEKSAIMAWTVKISFGTHWHRNTPKPFGTDWQRNTPKPFGTDWHRNTPTHAATHIATHAATHIATHTATHTATHIATRTATHTVTH